MAANTPVVVYVDGARGDAVLAPEIHVQRAPRRLVVQLDGTTHVILLAW